MAAPTNAAKCEKSSCQPGAVHTWHFSDLIGPADDVCSWVKRTAELRDRTSEFDAVDGSSTGTRVPQLWEQLRLPRFGGAIHANGYDNRSRHRQVGLPSSWAG